MRYGHRHLAARLVAMLLSTVLAACSSTFSVVRVEPEAVYQEPAGDRLEPASGQAARRGPGGRGRRAAKAAAAETVAGPSSRTRQTLRIQNLEGLWDSHPELVIRALTGMIRESDDRTLLTALAELAWIEAQRMDLANPIAASGWYLMAASRAYDYLFAPASEMDRAFDPDFDLMVEVYMKAAAGYLHTLLAQVDKANLSDHFREVLGESYRIRIDRGRGVWNPDDFDELVLADALDVRGFRNRHRQSGLGVPLAGVRANPGRGTIDSYYPPEGLFFPVTAVLRFDVDEAPPSSELEIFDDFVSSEGQRDAVLALYDPHTVPSIEIGGRQVPLAADFTAPLALLLERNRLRKIARAGILNAERAFERQGFFMMEPYDPAKTPLLMIHGLGSSAHIWAEMTNDLFGDPEIRRAFQVWHYIYPSSLPYIYTGALLRQDLGKVRRDFDPNGSHPAMRSMVVVAHSMGGLLTKTLISASGTRLWDAVALVPPDEIEGDPEVVETFRNCFIFEPLPYVDRVVFISTPHQGSRMSDSFIGKLGSALVDLPEEFRDITRQVAEANWERIQPEMRKVLAKGGPTSIRALSPNNPVLQSLASIPIDAEVTVHTIIGDRDSIVGDPEVDSDGIVTHESAHLQEAVSEIFVPSKHNAYAHPLTILEVKRILREHLKAAATVKR